MRRWIAYNFESASLSKMQLSKTHWILGIVVIPIAFVQWIDRNM